MVQLADTQTPAAGANVFLIAPESPQPRPAGDFIISIDQADQPTRGEFHATADSSGRVELQGIRPGEYFIVAQVPGYISPESYIAPNPLSPVQSDGSAGLPQFVRNVIIHPGQQTHFDLHLERGGIIEGRVTFDNDQPAHRGGAIWSEVALSLLLRKPDGSFGYASVGAAHTDSSGHYRFDGLPQASYVVIAAAPEEGMVQTSRGMSSSDSEVIFSGNTQRLTKAKVVEVKGTLPVTVDIVMPLVGLHRITGTVLAPDGKPLQEGHVRLTPTGETDSYLSIPFASQSVPLQPDGSFAFHSATADTYTLSLVDEPTWEFAGMTTDGKGMKMKYKPRRYAPALQTVTVGPSNPAPVILQLTAAH